MYHNSPGLHRPGLLFFDVLFKSIWGDITCAPILYCLAFWPGGIEKYSAYMFSGNDKWPVGRLSFFFALAAACKILQQVMENFADSRLETKAAGICLAAPLQKSEFDSTIFRTFGGKNMAKKTGNKISSNYFSFPEGLFQVNVLCLNTESGKEVRA